MTKKQIRNVKKVMAMVENKKFYGGDFDREYTSVVEGPLFRSPFIPRESQFISSATVNPDGLCCFKSDTLRALGVTESKPEKEVCVNVNYCDIRGTLVVPEHVAKYLKSI